MEGLWNMVTNEGYCDSHLLLLSLLYNQNGIDLDSMEIHY